MGAIQIVSHNLKTLGLQISNHQVGIAISVKVGRHHRSTIKIKAKPSGEMGVNKTVLFTGKEAIDFSARKTLGLVAANALRTTAKEILIVLIVFKEPVLLGRKRIDVYFFTSLLRDTGDNLPPVETSQIFRPGPRIVTVGLVDILIAI